MYQSINKKFTVWSNHTIKNPWRHDGHGRKKIRGFENRIKSRLF